MISTHWMTVVLFVSLPMVCIGDDRMKVNLKGTSIAAELSRVSRGVAKGNQRKADVPELTFDPKTGEFKGRLVVTNRQIITVLGKKEVLYDYTSEKAFSVDLNDLSADFEIDFGRGSQIEGREFLRSLGISRNWSLLTVTSEPDGADILINNRKWGKTRRDGFTDAGKYTLTVRMTGYEEMTDEVVLEQGKVTEKSYTLTKLQ